MNINEAFPTKYLKSSDIDGLPTKEATVLISSVMIEDVGTQQAPEHKPIVHFQGADKGMVLNKTNALAMEMAFGPETDRWIGQKVVVFTQPVMFQGKQVQGLRLRAHFEPVHQAGSALAPQSPVSPPQGLPDGRPTPPIEEDEIPF